MPKKGGRQKEARERPPAPGSARGAQAKGPSKEAERSPKGGWHGGDECAGATCPVLCPVPSAGAISSAQHPVPCPVQAPCPVLRPVPCSALSAVLQSPCWCRVQRCSRCWCRAWCYACFPSHCHARFLALPLCPVLCHAHTAHGAVLGAEPCAMLSARFLVPVPWPVLCSVPGAVLGSRHTARCQQLSKHLPEELRYRERK